MELPQLMVTEVEVLLRMRGVPIAEGNQTIFAPEELARDGRPYPSLFFAQALTYTKSSSLKKNGAFANTSIGTKQ